MFYLHFHINSLNISHNLEVSNKKIITILVMFVCVCFKFKPMTAINMQLVYMCGHTTKAVRSAQKRCIAYSGLIMKQGTFC